MTLESPAHQMNARYLLAKRSVDDRALNKDVVDRLRIELTRAVPAATPRVLELGAGLGTMLARVVEWGVVTRAEWWLLDVDADMLMASRRWLAAWAGEKQYRIEPGGDALRIVSAAGDVDLTIRTIEVELGDFLAAAPPAPLSVSASSSPYPSGGPPPADLLIASAFLDLVDLATVLSRLLERVRPDGIYWFSINYDGETCFAPHHAHDQVFLRIYNRSMDERVRYDRPAGHSQTGRRLFTELPAAGASILAAGSSDWVVFPDADRRYPFAEDQFLHHIIDTVNAELTRHGELDQGEVRAWTALRHAQVEAGALVYLAHQLDFVGRVPLTARR